MAGPATTGGGGAGVVSGSAPAALPTTGPVTASEVYQLLLQSGLSTAQAIGVMANAIAESSLNPEAHNPHDPTQTCPGAQSFGLLQWNTCTYPNAAGLVTGNPQADIRSQIKFLLSNVSQSALVGATGAQVAGNFAANFERCASCQQGGAEYNARVANAAIVSGWISSGNWPTSAGGITGAGSSSSSSNTNGCLINFPGVLGIGQTCLFSSSQARALIGGALIAAAMPVGLVGAVILAAFAFRRTGAGAAAGRAAQAVGGAVSLIPGAEPAGAAVAAAGGLEARRSRAEQEEAQERHTARQYARQRRARENLDRDTERELEPAPF